MIDNKDTKTMTDFKTSFLKDLEKNGQDQEYRELSIYKQDRWYIQWLENQLSSKSN